ncbi:MAG: DUF4126 domain-containing protein [Propionibacteriaceae bacterium]|nr:DUF4126 domain-containing protein [Propionibacteriaceae bacterium]
MDLLPVVFASGWASGVNAYATAFVLGVCGRFIGIPGVPDALHRNDVLIALGVLALIEFVADKIPYIDSIWDAIGTVIRPIAGATLGALFAGASGDLWTVTLASVGGLSALMSHLVKASLRLAINTSPEPASNIMASAAEDALVTVVAALALLAPALAATIALLLLVLGLAAAWFAWTRIVRGWRAFRRWRERQRTRG